MTKLLDQVLYDDAKKHFEKNGITVTAENKSALFDMYKAHRLAGREIERTHEYLRSAVDDFNHPDQEKANIKANAAIAMLSNALNGSSVLSDVFQKMFQYNTGHRTLDGNVINELFSLIKFIAEDDKHFYVDDRNRHVKELCKDAVMPLNS